MPSIAQPADRDFEITFADLAHAQLRDKAPALLDYLLGFQVIDSNEDQTHGVGVMGFKVGEQMLYVPSFFLNGELKQNLIYIKNQDLFVPLQDNWVTYLLNRRPMIMGEAEPQREQDLGVMQPNLAPLSNTLRGGAVSNVFGTRTASWEDWAKGALGMFQKIGDRHPNALTLPTFLNKTANYWTSAILAKAMRADPEFGNTVLQYHPVKSLMHKPGCVGSAGRKKKKQLLRSTPPHIKKSSVLYNPAAFLDRNGPHRVQVLHGQVNDRLLPSEDMEKLARGEFVFKDARDEANVAYKTDEGTKLTNPSEPGIYQLLLSSGKYKEAHIFPAPKAIGKGYIRVALVVDADSKNFGYWWCNELLVKPVDGEFLANPYGNKSMSELGSISGGDTCTIVSKEGIATSAFTVKKKMTGQNGLTELFVNPIFIDPGKGRNAAHVNAEDVTQFGEGSKLPTVGDVTSNTGRVDELPALDENAEKAFAQLNHIVITNDDRDMRVVGNTLFVPNTAKVLKLKSGSSLETWAMSDPSSLLDVEANLLKEGAESITFLRKGSTVYVNEQGPFDKADLVVALVKKAGLRGEAAVALVDGLRDDKRARFLIKNAIGYAPAIPEPARSYDDYAGVMEQYPQEEWLPVDGMPMPSTEGYLGKPEKQQIMEAAQTGQKEIFDTSAIASLVRTSDSDDLIVQYLSDIILGLDRVSRILFLFYWLNEQFRDRYGQENLVELEDQLKNVSKSVGDLVLFLKQRSVEGSPSFDAQEIEMGAGMR